MEHSSTAGQLKGSASLNWFEVDADQTGMHPRGLADIRRRAIDGFTIPNVFDEATCERAVQILSDHRDRDPEPADFGSMLGMPLPVLARVAPGVDDRTLYLDSAARAGAYLNEAFGQNPFDRISHVLQPMANGLELCTIDEGGRAYAAGNVRWMEPGKGGLPAHVGNEFLMHTDSSMNHLRRVTTTVDHFSWFVVLQEPQSGGALSVFDDQYETEIAGIDPWTSGGRNDAPFDSRPCLKVPPSAGCMAIFGGGWRWHRVDKVFGSRPRVTYGGFASMSTDGSAYNFWF